MLLPYISFKKNFQGKYQVVYNLDYAALSFVESKSEKIPAYEDS